MAAAFPGYTPRALTFLRQIAKNNNRAWFQAHKDLYEIEVRGATRVLVEALNGKLQRFAPDYVADPKKSIPRIYRDLRFTHDKSPYKVNVACVFPYRRGKRGEVAGYYVSVAATGVEVIAGARQLTPPKLRALRAHFADDHSNFERLCNRKALRETMGTLQGDQLKRVPPGWPQDHPAADLLRRKQLYFQAKLPAKTAATPDLLTELVRHFRVAAPFVRAVDAALAG